MRLALTSLIIFQLLACQRPGKEVMISDQESTAVVREVNDKEIVCFVYHHFGDGRYPSTNISLKNFEAHLNYLKNNDYQVLSFSEAIRYLKSDADKQNTAVITIDDGYKSFVKNGLPLLKKYGFPATLFINTETVGNGDYMSWEEIKTAINNEIEIGNHTHSHNYFLNISEASRYKTFEDEIKLSQELIKKNAGVTPTSFAYPYGELDSEMKEIVSALGFEAAAAQNSGVISSSTDLMQCPRFPMSEAYSDIDKFIAKVRMKALPVINISPESFIIRENQGQPTILLTFEKGDLQLDQLQCFIQGAECSMSSKVSEEGIVTVNIQPKTTIANRRRTLYTITVPDEQGKWHWFSHLFINPNKGE